MRHLIDTSICCLINYNQRIVYVEAIMIDSGFQILFNSKPVTQIEVNDKFNWEIINGAVLPDEIINEIGSRIERKFNH